MSNECEKKWTYYTPANSCSADGCQAVYIGNIDTSLRRIADSLENGEKLKQRDETLGKAEKEIQRLADELGEAKVALAKMEGKAAHFEAAHFEAAYKIAASGEADLQALVRKAIANQCANEDKGDCLHCIRCGDCPTKDWVDTLNKHGGCNAHTH